MMAETGVILTPDQRVRVFISSTLEELAAFADGLRPPGGADEVAAAAGALRRTAANLMAHVEAV